MYFEIYKKGKLIKRWDKILGDISFSNELMYTPSTDIELPVDFLEYVSGREEVKLYVNDKCFYGIVKDLPIDKDKETITLGLEHVISEWDYRQISINNAVKAKKVNIIYKEEDESHTNPTVQDQLDDIYADTNFAYPGWKLNMSSKAADTTIDYVYSKQGKLEALTKTMELTDDLFWRVRMIPTKEVDISEFGEKKQYIISGKPAGVNNIQIIEAPQVEIDFDNVFNLATVYAEKSDSGMSSLTLREVYDDPTLQKDGFPCVILRSNVNNERDYTKYITQYPKLAPNNELEYAVIDEESVALEGGQLIETSLAFNDLSPFNTDDTKEITDKDRIRAARTVYDATIKKLKLARRSTVIKVKTTPIPNDINPGDKVRFIYDNSVYILDACSGYEKQVLAFDDWFYVTHIDYDISEDGTEVDTLTLEKYLKLDRG